MQRFALAAVAASLILAGTMTATAAQTPTTSHHTPPSPCARHHHPAAEDRALAATTFAYRNWRSVAPGAGAVKTSRVLRGCVDKRVRARMADDWRAERADLRLQRRYRLLATEPGFAGEGRFLRWLVIPKWVVEAETSECGAYGETHAAGECRWTIANPESGACGPYQLLDHTSCDTSSPGDKLRHHEVAATLPLGSWAVGY